MPEISDNADVLVSVVTGNSFTYDWGRQSRQLRRYQSALLVKDARDIDILKALDKTKPKLVVFAGAGFNGIDEDLGTSMGDFSSFNHLLVEGGVRLTLPGGKEPLYSVKRAQLERAIQDNNIELLTEESQLELKRSSRQVKLLKSVMDNRLMISESLARKYQEDLRQFDIGRLSIDVLIESQDRHLEAQLLAIQSKYQYLQAICRHFRVDNTLLSKIAFIKEGK
jgi:outer membrane protein TolC